MRVGLAASFRHSSMAGSYTQGKGPCLLPSVSEVPTAKCQLNCRIIAAERQHKEHQDGIIQVEKYHLEIVSVNGINKYDQKARSQSSKSVLFSDDNKRLCPVQWGPNGSL